MDNKRIRQEYQNFSNEHKALGLFKDKTQKQKV